MEKNGDSSSINPFVLANLKLSRDSYANFAMLYTVLSKYSSEETEKTQKELEAYITIFQLRGMPLPSGRWGNSLAVALEMQMYKGALFMINNAERLEIDLENVSSVLGGESVWNVQEVFEFSKLSFDFTKLSDDDEFYKDYPGVVKYKNDNIEAAKKIEEILSKKTFERNRIM